MEGSTTGWGGRSIALRHSPFSPRVARRFVHQALADMGRLATETDALLCVSEMVANAVQYSSGTCVVALHDVEGAIRLEVHDHSTAMPRLENPPLVASGRGMAIIAALAARWGVDVWRADGKTVWCQLDNPLADRTPPA